VIPPSANSNRAGEVHRQARTRGPAHTSTRAQTTLAFLNAAAQHRRIMLQSGSARRRLAKGKFPSDWPSLGDAELERLRDAALESKPARRPIF